MRSVLNEVRPPQHTPSRSPPQLSRPCLSLKTMLSLRCESTHRCSRLREQVRFWVGQRTVKSLFSRVWRATQSGGDEIFTRLVASVKIELLCCRWNEPCCARSLPSASSPRDECAQLRAALGSRERPCELCLASREADQVCISFSRWRLRLTSDGTRCSRTPCPSGSHFFNLR